MYPETQGLKERRDGIGQLTREMDVLMIFFEKKSEPRSEFYYLRNHPSVVLFPLQALEDINMYM
jgi:hypothetical protein